MTPAVNSDRCWNQQRTPCLPVWAGFALHHRLISPPLPPTPLLSVPRVCLAVVTVRNSGCPAAPVTNPREIILPGNGPGFEIPCVLRNTGERHFWRVVILPGFVTGLLSCPERAPAPRRRGAGGTLLRARVVIPGRALRGGDLFGDGPHLLLDVRVVLDGERDGEVRFVELVPESSQAAHSADARPSHSAL